MLTRKGQIPKNLLFGWICLALGLLLLLTGCAGDERHIRPASEAAVAGSTGSGGVSLSWNRVMADSFDLDVATVPGQTGSGRKISNIANPIHITDLKIGATYYFVLTALINGKASLKSPQIAHTVKGRDDRIELPVAEGTTGIALTWDDAETAAAYNIYWRNTPGVTRQNGTKIPNVRNPHTVSGLIRGIPYYFVVTAVRKSVGESSVSKEISYQSDR